MFLHNSPVNGIVHNIPIFFNELERELGVRSLTPSDRKIDYTKKKHVFKIINICKFMFEFCGFCFYYYYLLTPNKFIRSSDFGMGASKCLKITAGA